MIKKQAVVILSLLWSVVSLVILFLPWVTFPILDSSIGTKEGVSYNGEGPSASPFTISGSIAKGGELLPEPKTAGEIAPSATAITILAAAICILLIAYIILLLKQHKRSTFVGMTGFIGLCVLSIMFLDMVYSANSLTAFAGPGLFTQFMCIAPLSYISLIWCVFGCVVIIPAAARTILDDKEKAPIRVRHRNEGESDFSYRFRGFLSDVLRDRHLYLMLIPFLAYYIVFYYFPYRGLEIAFLNYKPLLGYAGSNWVGFDNFVRFFTGPYFWRVLRNTLYLSVYSLVFGFPIPIILAILFHELRSKKLRTIAQTISYIPYFISTVVIAGMVINFLSPSAGIINIILGWFGVDPIYFITKTSYFRTIYVVQGIWAGAGFGSIIYYSSLCSIDSEMFEAATIDGAGRFRQILNIMLPQLFPTISIMLIMEIGNLLGASTEMVLLLYKPATYEVSDIIGTYVYRLSMAAAGGDYSLATAVGLFNGIVALVLVLSANKVSKQLGETSIF